MKVTKEMTLEDWLHVAGAIGMLWAGYFLGTGHAMAFFLIAAISQFLVLVRFEEV